MHWTIPDVPKIVQDQIERENLITQKTLWEDKPEIRSGSTYYLSSLCKKTGADKSIAHENLSQCNNHNFLDIKN
jgi:hypothetical protein